MLPDRFLENWVGRQNVNVPSLRFGNLAQAEDDFASTAEAGIPDNVQEPQWACLFIG
jgi:hypothetical protein